MKIATTGILLLHLLDNCLLFLHIFLEYFKPLLLFFHVIIKNVDFLEETILIVFFFFELLNGII